jgi:beta-lactamase regulating signal transducer with metallopeptidase domain
MHLLTQSALLQALGWTLVNSLWQMGLLWLSYWLLAGLFHSAPSRFRHGLALTLLAFGTLGSMITFIARYFFEDASWGIASFGVVSAGAWGVGNRLIAAALPWCSVLYLLILAILLVHYSYQYLYSRRLTREGLVKVPAEFRVFVASTSRLMGIRPAVKAWLSTRVDVPVTLGFLKPVILLPAAMLSQLSIQQVEAILVHELAHIRRRDYLLNLGVTFLGLVFFFNPFTRLLIRQLQKEREHCCDDEVLQFRYDPHAYVSALLSLARQHRQGRLALAATGAGDDQLLLQRARKILQQNSPDRRPGARPFILLFLTAAITVLSLSTPTRQQPDQTARNPQPAAAPLSGEMVFIPIVNTGEPKSSSGFRIGSVDKGKGSTIAGMKHPAGRTSSSADNPTPAVAPDEDDAPSLASMASADAQPRIITRAYTQPAALTITEGPAAPRDNSLGSAENDDDADDETASDLPPMNNLVFVPNSSFSFKQVDTLRPEDKLGWIEESTQKEIRAQMTRLENELKAQLQLLRSREAEARALTNASQQELKKALNQQIEIQHEYLRKLNELNDKIRKIRHLTTVYI